MAENKKGFVLYADQKIIVDELSDAQAGQLFKLIFAYVNDDDPQPKDQLLKLAFAPIKQQLKRDLVKYESKREQWSNAGKESARKRKENKQPLTDVKKRSTVSTVKDKDKVKAIRKPTRGEFLEFALSKKPNLDKESVLLKFDAWEANDWHTNKDGKEHPIKNWKTTILNTIPFLKIETPKNDLRAAHSNPVN